MSWRIIPTSTSWEATDEGGFGYVVARLPVQRGAGAPVVAITVGTRAIAEEAELTELLPLDVAASLARWLVAIEKVHREPELRVR